MKIQNPKSKIQNRLREAQRAQSTLEMALVLPILVLLLSVVIEGGLALNAWMRVTTAARDATRFALDAGRPDDISRLVREKLAGVEFGTARTYTQSLQLDIYIVEGATDNSGTISTWTVDHRYGVGSATPRVQRSTIQSRLNSQGAGVSRNIEFTIVEVDFRYMPLTSTLVARGTGIPMSSYAIVEHY
jgi:Flp pilus assembly protein TadG